MLTPTIQEGMPTRRMVKKRPEKSPSSGPNRPHTAKVSLKFWQDKATLIPSSSCLWDSDPHLPDKTALNLRVEETGRPVHPSRFYIRNSPVAELPGPRSWRGAGAWARLHISLQAPKGSTWAAGQVWGRTEQGPSLCPEAYWTWHLTDAIWAEF